MPAYKFVFMARKKFSRDPNTPSRKRARQLARADEELRAKLLQARKLRGMSQTDVAELMGVTQPAVSSFEDYDNDPRLSTIRRYAHAVRVTIAHTVTLDEGSEIECGWQYLGDTAFTYIEDAAQPSHRVEAPDVSQRLLVLAA